MEKRAFEIVGSRRLSAGERAVPISSELHQHLQGALEENGWGVFWSANADKSAMGRSLFPIRTAPPSLMQEIGKLHPLHLLGMPWGTALYLDEEENVVNYIISSPAAIEEVFFSDLPDDRRSDLRDLLQSAADALRKLGREIVGAPVGERFRGYRFPDRRQPGRDDYGEIVFERALRAGESARDAVDEVAGKMSDGLNHAFHWHVSGMAPVADTARIVMTCHAGYARLAMEMGTYHCPALPCTTVAYVENGKVKAAMLKPLHMFKTFFRDVPWWVGIRYIRFPVVVRREIRDCLCSYLDCRQA